MVGGEAPDDGDRLRALAFRPAAVAVVAVAAEQQLVLMPREKITRERFVSRFPPIPLT